MDSLAPIQTLTDPDLLLSIKDGNIKVVKNRYGPAKPSLSLSDTVELCSILLSNLMFKGNNLKMFREALRDELKKSISQTIVYFHTKGE